VVERSIKLTRWKEIILLTILIKAILFIVTAAINQPENIVDSWVRWDGPHYVDIAKNWYQTVGDPANFIVFYPLYPILIKVTSFFTNNFNLSALVVSFVCSIASSILLYELTKVDFGGKVALLAVWFLNIFPTAYFLQAAYTESLFLMLSLLSIYLYRKNQAFAGIPGFFASFTRFNGILLIPLFLVETFRPNINLKKMKFFFIISLLTVTGSITYFLINLLVFGELFYFTNPLTNHWFKKLEWPWIGINSLINFIPFRQDSDYYIFIGELIAIIFATILMIYTLIKIRLSYGVYMLLNLLLFTSTSFIMSTPRYLLILFPIYIALGKLNNKYLVAFISIIFIILLIQLALLYTEGKWAY